MHRTRTGPDEGAHQERLSALHCGDFCLEVCEALGAGHPRRIDQAPNRYVRAPRGATPATTRLPEQKKSETGPGTGTASRESTPSYRYAQLCSKHAYACDRARALIWYGCVCVTACLSTLGIEKLCLCTYVLRIHVVEESWKMGVSLSSVGSRRASGPAKKQAFQDANAYRW